MLNQTGLRNLKTGLESLADLSLIPGFQPQTQGMKEHYYVPIDTWPNGMNRMIVPLLNQVLKTGGWNFNPAS